MARPDAFLALAALFAAACAAAGDGPAHRPGDARGPAAVPAAQLEAYWAAASDFAGFLGRATRQRDAWEAHHRGASVREDHEARAAVLPGRHRLLAVVREDCVDCIGTVPYAAKLADAVVGLELRVLRAAEAAGLVSQYADPAAGAGTPLIVVLDDAYRERGCWRGPPAALRRRLEEEPPAAAGGALASWKLDWYAADRGASAVGEIVDRLEAAQRGARLCP